MTTEDNLTPETQALILQLFEKGYEVILVPNSPIFERQSIDSDWCCELGHPSKIHVRWDVPNQSAFAHELLHVDYWSQGFVSESELIKEFWNSPLSPEFIALFNNQLAHIKFYDKFIRMGFSSKDFVKDQPIRLSEIEDGLRSHKNSIYYLQIFFFASITAYASRKCNSRTEYEILELEQVLEKSDKELYMEMLEILSWWEEASPSANSNVFTFLFKLSKKGENHLRSLLTRKISRLQFEDCTIEPIS